MRKKELMNKLDSLVDSLNKLSSELKKSEQENAALKLKIEQLTNELSEEKSKEKAELQPAEIPVSEQTSEESAEQATPAAEPKSSEIPEKPEEQKAEAPKVMLPAGEKVVLPDSIMEFGSEIIGKIVIESAKYADTVAASASPDKKELLNLIMGKSEVCKAEILSIVTSDSDTETKINLINSQLAEATDYFKSVTAQI